MSLSPRLVTRRPEHVGSGSTKRVERGTRVIDLNGHDSRAVGSLITRRDAPVTRGDDAQLQGRLLWMGEMHVPVCDKDWSKAEVLLLERARPSHVTGDQHLEGSGGLHSQLHTISM